MTLIYTNMIVNNTLLHEPLCNEEAWAGWSVTDEKNCIIKFADGQEEGCWGYFDVNRWELIDEK